MPHRGRPLRPRRAHILERRRRLQAEHVAHAAEDSWEWVAAIDNGERSVEVALGDLREVCRDIHFKGAALAGGLEIEARLDHPAHLGLRLYGRIRGLDLVVGLEDHRRVQQPGADVVRELLRSHSTTLNAHWAT